MLGQSLAAPACLSLKGILKSDAAKNRSENKSKSRHLVRVQKTDKNGFQNTAILYSHVAWDQDHQKYRVWQKGGVLSQWPSRWEVHTTLEVHVGLWVFCICCQAGVASLCSVVRSVLFEQERKYHLKKYFGLSLTCWSLTGFHRDSCKSCICILLFQMQAQSSRNKIQNTLKGLNVTIFLM